MPWFFAVSRAHTELSFANRMKGMRVGKSHLHRVCSNFIKKPFRKNRI